MTKTLLLGVLGVAALLQAGPLAKAAEAAPPSGTHTLTATPAPRDALTPLSNSKAQFAQFAAAKPKHGSKKAMSQLPDTLYLAEFDTNTSGKREGSAMLLVTAASADSARIGGIHGLTGSSLGAKADLTAGTIKVWPGKVYQHSTYGAIWACAYNPETNTFNTSTPISGTINDDGSITLSSWGVFAVEGSYRGTSFGLYTSSNLKPSNATITDVTFKTSVSKTATEVYPSYVEQASDNKLTVFNFGNYGNAVITVDLLHNNAVSIVPQYITSTTSADCFCYPAKWSDGLRGIKDNINGTGTATTISLGNWAVCSRTSLSTRQRNVVSTVITVTDGNISYPAAPELDWEGNGTKDSPYTITTAKQLVAFAQTVNAGTSYNGKYVALDADIDLQEVSNTFKPIGSSETNCFQGYFNGRSHTVSGLTIDAGEQIGVGLFGYTGANSLVHDINISGFNITTYGKYAGALAGLAKGTVANVTVTGTSITAYGLSTGGVIGGYQGSNLSNAEFSGTVSGWGVTGGIVGELRGKVKQSRNHGRVTMSQYYDDSYTGVGGIAGATVYGSTRSSITDCYNDGHIIGRSSASLVGGVVGQMQTADMQRCFNVGLINGVSSVSSSLGEGATAGVAGKIYGCTVSDSYNGNYVINSYTTNCVGGIVGQVATPTSVIDNGVVVRYENTSSVTRCYNSGQVVQPALYATQGMWGKSYADSVFTKCYFDRQTTGNEIGEELKSSACETAQLASASGLDGINTTATWVLADGMYPRLKGYESVTSAIVAATPAYLADSETTQKVKHNFTVSTTGGVKWKAYNDTTETYGAENAAVTVADGTVTLKSATTTGIIVAMMGDDESFYKRLWIKTINPNGFSGSGTEADPYLIKSKADLIELRNGVNGSSQHYKGEYFKQTANIDLTEGEGSFTGIGTDGYSSHIFGGIYDGNNHSISNLVINGLGADAKGKASKTNSTSFVGLFGYLENGAVIKNLTIASGDISGWQYAGGIAGYNDGLITNCRNFATVKTAYAYSAGIAGYMSSNGVVTECYNAGEIIAGRYYAGGIAGFSCGRVDASQNDGNVKGAFVNAYKPSGQRYAAGIVAQCYGPSEVTNCINTGNVTASLGVAGIAVEVATTGESVLKGNINYGMVTSETATSDVNGAILGATAANGTTLTSNYFDKQINWQGAMAMTDGEGMNGTLTRELTSGKQLDGIDANVVDLAAGKYPVIKAFKDEPAAVAARNMVLTLGDNETTDDITGNSTVASYDGLQWTLKSGKQFALNGNTLSLQLADSDRSSVRDTLTATIGDYAKVLPLRAMPVLFEGKGTQADPYLIKTKEDMITLASATTGDGFSYNGRYFKVVNDIDFGTTVYEPVACGSAKFNADFDGDNHQFLNVNYGNSASQYVAMFGEVGAKGRLHDFTLASGSIGAGSYTAGVAANVFGTVERVTNKATVATLKSTGLGGVAAVVKKGGRVISCRNEGAIEPYANSAAGIAYKVEVGGLVDSCVNAADITSAKDIVGGVVAQSLGTVRNCVNLGTISGKTTVAGVVAQVEGSDSTLYCRNEGAVKSTAGRVGGVVGYKSATADISVLIGCTNSATITSAKGSVGGVAGRLQEGSYMIDCSNSGEIVNTSSSYTGGVVGSLESISAMHSLAQNCHNTGAVNNTGTGSYVGGVAGNTNQNTDFIDCYNTGDVYSGGNYVGGVASSLSGNVVRCYNTGNITAKGIAVAGLAGLGWANVRDSYNIGDITSTDGNSKNGVAGGLWGYGKPQFYNCYNMGTVTAKAYAGGITGGVANGFVCENVYTAGRLVVTDTATCGQISPAGNYTIAISNTYYDTDVNQWTTTSNVDSLAIGASTRTITLTNLCDTAFDTAAGMYPTLKAFSTDTLANWFAAVPVVAEGENYEHVRSAFWVGVPDGTVWTCSDNISIAANGKADSNAEGEAWVTKTFGNHTRTYALYVEKATGTGNINADAAIVRTTYYTIGGMQLGDTVPSEPGVYVASDLYSNGKTQSRKLIVR